MLRKKSVIALVIVSLVFLPTMITFITAQKPTVNVYLSTDKAYYKYGESGKLYVTVRNEGPYFIAIRKIKITFPWFGWYHGNWTGNATRTEIEENLLDKNQTSEPIEFEFTVPAEGRGGITNAARVSVEYEWGDETDSVTEYIPILIEWPITQSEALAPILYLTAGITVLFILALIALFFMWLSLRKLASSPPAVVATQ